MKIKSCFFILLLLFMSCSSDESTFTGTGNTDGTGSTGGIGSSGSGGTGSSGSGGTGDTGDTGGISGEWTIPIDQVFDGGPGKDGIPSIDNPVFRSLKEEEVKTYMFDNDLVLGIVNGTTSRAYPHKILDWHEVVNDDIFGKKVTISYCPLTGTAFGWESLVNNQYSEFGVSGLLYNTNLILYDRKSNSHWSQLKLECVNGEFIGEKPKVVNIIETTWKLWKEMYPKTKVLSNKQGFDRNYNNYPYGNYKENHSFFLFPVSNLDNSIPNKDRIHAIVSGNSAKVFQFHDFNSGKAIKSKFLSDDILIVGNQKIINSYTLNSNQVSLVFEYEPNASGYSFKDDEGNKWNILGEAIDGPRKGEILKPTVSLMSYWFAIAAFYSEREIYK